MRFRNHAALPHFSRGQGTQALKPGLKSTQKIDLTLPANPRLRINWEKFGSPRRAPHFGRKTKRSYLLSFDKGDFRYRAYRNRMPQGLFLLEQLYDGGTAC
jgi:hypothetical protein